jgi:trehalose 6-phosphate phosphatase
VLADVLTPVTQDPGRAGVFLDIDGTLAPIVERSEDAALPASTVRALEALVPRYALVACVSGRAAAEARRMVGIEGVVYAGSHGAELLEPGADAPEVPPAFAEWGPRVREFVAAQDTGDLRVEHKGAIVALHWRGVPEGAEQRAREIAESANGFVTHWGRMVLEIRPPVEFNKGDAVTELIRRHDLRAALFAGDDNTDLDAFEALDALPAAVRVGVRSEEGPRAIVERADLVVDGPEGVVEVLAALA